MNFPFDALKPDFAGADLQAMQRAAHDCFALGARNVPKSPRRMVPVSIWARLLAPAGTLPPSSIEAIERLVVEAAFFSACRRGLPCETVAEAEEILLGAQACRCVLTDPLSGAPIDDPLIIDN